MRRIAASAGVALAIFVVAAAAGMILTCGDADTAMPDPGACPARSPTPTSRRDPLGFYRVTLTRNVDRIDTLTAQFRQKYPNGKFYRSGNFRADFARYADETVCIAEYLRGLTLPADLAAVEAAFDTAIDEFVAHQLQGREAVKSRNVSEYRDWFKAVDGRMTALRRVSQVVP